MGTVSIWKCPRNDNHQLIYLNRRTQPAGYWCPDCIRLYTQDELEYR